MNCLMDKIKEYRDIVLIVLAVVGFAWYLRTIDAKASEGMTMAQQQVQTNKQQSDINAKLTAMVIESNTKLAVYLELMGFDDDQARMWSAMPRSIPLDSLGKPISMEPWLEVREELQVGIRLMVDDSATVMIDTLWDFRRAKR